MEEPDAKRARFVAGLQSLVAPSSGAPAGFSAAPAGFSADPPIHIRGHDVPAGFTGDAEIHIPQQYVGWLKGSQGRQIKDIQIRSGATVDIDQSTKDLGYSRAVITGQPAAVQAATDIINNELARVTDRDGFNTIANLPLGESIGEVQIPQKYVGWLKGSGGGQIKDMEAKSGASVRIDQSTREAGYSVAQITGNEQAVSICKGLIEAELHHVQERDRIVELHKQTPSLQANQAEVRIPQQYVGWIKGAGGAQIKDIEGRTGAHITIDQTSQEIGYSRAMVYGDPDRVAMAVNIIETELARVMGRDRVPGGPSSLAHQPVQRSGVPNLTPASVEGAVGIVGALRDTLSAAISSGQAQQNPLGLLSTLLSAAQQANSSQSASAAATPTSTSALVPMGSSAPRAMPHDPSDTGEWDIVRIPSSCVGWLKGKRGAMIREIEGRSGAVVDVDQTTKDRGYSTAQIRGATHQKKVAFGLVVSEVMKAMDSSGEKEDFPLGHKHEFRIDSQYVGWVKGPKGKVVQDIQVKSATRIDVDQTGNMGTAGVRIYGTAEGVPQARQLLASELSKVSLEAAQLVAGDLPFERKTSSRDQLALANQAASASATTFAPPSGYQGATMGATMGAAQTSGSAYDLSPLLGQQQQQQQMQQQVAYGQPAGSMQAAQSYMQPQQQQPQQHLQQAIQQQVAATSAALQQFGGLQLQQSQQQPQQLGMAGNMAGSYGQQPQLQAQLHLQHATTMPSAAPDASGTQAIQLAQALQQIVNAVQNVVAPA